MKTNKQISNAGENSNRLIYKALWLILCRRSSQGKVADGVFTHVWLLSIGASSYMHIFSEEAWYLSSENYLSQGHISKASLADGARLRAKWRLVATAAPQLRHWCFPVLFPIALHCVCFPVIFPSVCVSNGKWRLVSTASQLCRWQCLHLHSAHF